VSDNRIRVAIAGVGNCASSLVQGVGYYAGADPDEKVPGLMHVKLGDYHVADVDFVAAFDVDAAKVGLDLGKAIFSGQNNTIRFADVPQLGVLVQRGPTLDGLGKYYRETIEESNDEPVDDYFDGVLLHLVEGDVLGEIADEPIDTNAREAAAPSGREGRAVPGAAAGPRGGPARGRASDRPCQ